jgi:hypothetical protein
MDIDGSGCELSRLPRHRHIPQTHVSTCTTVKFLIAVNDATAWFDSAQRFDRILRRQAFPQQRLSQRAAASSEIRGKDWFPYCSLKFGN